MGESGSQCSPAAIMHAMPSGIVMMMDHVAPAASVRTSITPPLLARPTATGASLNFLDRWLSADARSVQWVFGWAACAMLLVATTYRTSPAKRPFVPNMSVSYRFGPPGNPAVQR